MEWMQTEINPFPFYTIEIDSSLFDDNQKKKFFNKSNWQYSPRTKKDAHAQAHTLIRWKKSKKLVYVYVPSHKCTHTNAYLVTIATFSNVRVKKFTVGDELFTKCEHSESITTCHIKTYMKKKKTKKLLFGSPLTFNQTMCLPVHYFSLLISLQLKYIRNEPSHCFSYFGFYLNTIPFASLGIYFYLSFMKFNQTRRSKTTHTHMMSKCVCGFYFFTLLHFVWHPFDIISNLLIFQRSLAKRKQNDFIQNIED